MEDKELQELKRLTEDNNRMLHAMRRNAFWGGLIKFVIYAALLLAPIWFYMTYLDATVQRMLNTFNQVQGTGAKASAQFSDFENMWKEFQSKFGSGSK